MQKIMTDFANFLHINEISKTEMAKFLSVSNSFITKLCNGEKKLPQDQRVKILSNDKGWDTSALAPTSTDLTPGQTPKASDRRENRIPIYDTQTIGGLNGMVANTEEARVDRFVNAGDWFPNATSAIVHYGDSMVEYPSGCILVLKRVYDKRLLVNGQNYVIETDEYRITKKVSYDGSDTLMAYSTNKETYPDGRLVYAPIKVPTDSIRHIDLVVGCIIQQVGQKLEFNNGK